MCLSVWLCFCRSDSLTPALLWSLQEAEVTFFSELQHRWIFWSGAGLLSAFRRSSVNLRIWTLHLASALDQFVQAITTEDVGASEMSKEERKLQQSQRKSLRCVWQMAAWYTSGCRLNISAGSSNWQLNPFRDAVRSWVRVAPTLGDVLPHRSCNNFISDNQSQTGEAGGGPVSRSVMLQERQTEPSRNQHQNLSGGTSRARPCQFRSKQRSREETVLITMFLCDTRRSKCSQADPIRSQLHQMIRNRLSSAYRNLYFNIYWCFSELSAVTDWLSAEGSAEWFLNNQSQISLQQQLGKYCPPEDNIIILLLSLNPYTGQYMQKYLFIY